MSYFAVTMETVESVEPHPNADALDLVKNRGMSFQFVVPKGKFKIGDKALCFPIDSEIPEPHLVVMNLSGKLAGSKKNRVKTIQLRQVLSQGVLEIPEKLLPKEFLDKNPDPYEITKYLGVTKYEPPVVVTNDAILKKLPENCSIYDIEGADRYGDIVERLRQHPLVAITEKMEGTNFSLKRDADNKIYVNSRTSTIEEEAGKNNMYWEAARASNLIVDACNMPFGDVIIYAELCGPGIQKNIYKLKKLTLFIFDLKIDGKWVSYLKRKELCEKYLPNHQMAPLLYLGPLDEYLGDKTIQQMSDGKSVVNPQTDREGIVLEKADEVVYIQGFGREKIKQRGPIYLCKTDF